MTTSTQELAERLTELAKDFNIDPWTAFMLNDESKVISDLHTAAALICTQVNRLKQLEEMLTEVIVDLDRASFVCSSLADADLFQETSNKARTVLEQKL